MNANSLDYLPEIGKENVSICVMIVNLTSEREHLPLEVEGPTPSFEVFVCFASVFGLSSGFGESDGRFTPVDNAPSSLSEEVFGGGVASSSSLVVFSSATCGGGRRLKNNLRRPPSSLTNASGNGNVIKVLQY